MRGRLRARVCNFMYSFLYFSYKYFFAQSEKFPFFSIIFRHHSHFVPYELEITNLKCGPFMVESKVKKGTTHKRERASLFGTFMSNINELLV